jgi:hypothetical protein
MGGGCKGVFEEECICTGGFAMMDSDGRIRCKTSFVRINGARIGEANSRELVS